MDALTQLAQIIATGETAPEGGGRPYLEALFGGRYHKRYEKQAAIRDPLTLGAGKETGVPYAGLIHPENPPSGAYGGTSLVWFPIPGEGSIITFVVGTGGLSPDEGLLTRPGHRRRIAALRRYLTRKNIATWTKADPTALGVEVPKVVRDRFKAFSHVFQRYGTELYAVAKVPTDDLNRAREVVQAFVDLYAYERGWEVLNAYQEEYEQLMTTLQGDLFPAISANQVAALLKERRFVVLQGPPGTGKTRLAEEVRRQFFAGRGTTVQFHPAVTYEDFVVGLSPDVGRESLHFGVRRGWLLEAALQAQDGPYLLVIDEINRSDLGKVLGEAIYLFEPREVGGPTPRTVTLPHPVPGIAPDKRFSLPENLYVLATMNTADRSIAGMDLAVRRRFAFVTMPPNREVIVEQGLELAIKVFDQLTAVFTEHAPDDALSLLPGHSYFLARDETELKARFKYELIPLLDEYLREGLLGSFAAELQAVRDRIEDVSEHGHWIG